MVSGDIIISPGFQFNSWLNSCTLGRGQDETIAWKYREAEEASSKMHTHWKIFYISASDAANSEQEGRQKPMIQADRT